MEIRFLDDQRIYQGKIRIANTFIELAYNYIKVQYKLELPPAPMKAIRFKSAMQVTPLPGEEFDENITIDEAKASLLEWMIRAEPDFLARFAIPQIYVTPANKTYVEPLTEMHKLLIDAREETMDLGRVIAQNVSAQNVSAEVAYALEIGGETSPTADTLAEEIRRCTMDSLGLKDLSYSMQFSEFKDNKYADMIGNLGAAVFVVSQKLARPLAQRIAGETGLIIPQQDIKPGEAYVIEPTKREIYILTGKQ